MKLTFKEKYGSWAIVTGASSGIGKALAFEIAKKEINLVLVSRNQKVLDELATELKTLHNIQTKVIALDLKEVDFITTLSEQTADIDIGLIANIAGEMFMGNYDDLPVEKELEMIQLNIIAPTIITRHYAEKLVAKKRGGIILTGSMLGFMGTPYSSTYAATKAYEITRGEGLNYELNKHGVDVLIVSPGLTKTPMTAKQDFSPLPMKMSNPEEVAKNAIQMLGKKTLTTYGGMNNVMNWMSKHFMTRKMNTNMFGYFLKKVLK